MFVCESVCKYIYSVSEFVIESVFVCVCACFVRERVLVCVRAYVTSA